METELTKNIKRSLHSFKPAMNSNMRTIRYADEVWTPTGIVDVIRFEDYIANDNSYCLRINPGPAEVKYCSTKEVNGKCKIDGLQYPNPRCKGCVFKRTVHECGILTTCFEVKISYSDFKSENGHNFCGNKNYYAVPDYLYDKIKSEVEDDVGIIVYYPKTSRMVVKKESKFKEIDKELMIRLLYDSLKKWCDNKQMP